MLVDGDGRAWLVDFDQAVAGAGDARLARDRQALEAVLADVAGRASASPRLDASPPPA